VEIYSGSGLVIGFGNSGGSGDYVTANLPAGTYYAQTLNSGGYINEQYNGITCAPCSATGGTPIVVTAGSTTSAINFALAVGGGLSGQVTRAADGAPIAYVEVKVYNAGNQWVTSGSTDGWGNYTSSAGLPTGTYYATTDNGQGYIEALFNGKSCLNCTPSSGTPIPVTVGNTTADIDFALMPGGRIGGTITNAAGSTALANTTVNVYDSTGWVVTSGHTDAWGNYVTSSGLPTGTYYAQTWNRLGYINEWYDHIVCPDCSVTSATPIVVTTGATIGSIDFALATGGRIAGKVTHEASAAPLANVVVSVYNASNQLVTEASSEIAGNYITDGGLPAGSYYARTVNSLNLVDKLYNNLPCNHCTPSAGTPIAVSVGATTTNINFALRPPPPTTITASLATVPPGGTMTFLVANAPGSTTDWVGLYCPATEPDLMYSAYKYLSNTQTPPAKGLTGATITFIAPTTVGATCDARFYANNSMTKLATSGTVPVVNPVPAITTLNPSSIVAGSAGFTLTVTGTGLVPGSVVHVNGAARTTAYGSATQVTAAIPATDVAMQGSNPAITMVNPTPGGGTSSAAPMTVTAPLPVSTITPIPTTVPRSGTMTFLVANGPGNTTDWVGLYCPTTEPDSRYSAWKYLSNTQTPPASGLTEATVTFAAPTTKGGTCNARLFHSNSFARRATSSSVLIKRSPRSRPTASPGQKATVQRQRQRHGEPRANEHGGHLPRQ
jgi:hypothetical protein